LDAAGFALLLPPGLAPGIALILIVASFFTSALTAAFGLGGGVALLALMGAFMPVASLIPVHGVVQLGSNSSRALVLRSEIVWSSLVPFLGGAIIGAVAGTFIVIQLPDAPMKLALGAFILFVVWVKLPPFDALGRHAVAIAGVFVAFLSMLFGAAGPLMAAFFERAFSDRRQMVATSGAAMVSVHALKTIAFAAAGFAFAPFAALMAAMIISGYLGTRLGARLLSAMPERVFRTGLKVLITLMALDMIRRGLPAVRP
jgi:uncharacterized protein